MFCPKCRSEYKEGVKVCAECEVPLVATLPEKPKRRVPKDRDKDLEFVSVVRTFIPQDIAIIKSLLADSGIEYYIRGETGMITYPLVDPASVMVVKEQADEARELLKDLKLGFYVFGPDHPEENEPDGESSK
jgi:hypothetical protein